MNTQELDLDAGETQQFWWNWLGIPVNQPAPFLLAQAFPWHRDQGWDDHLLVTQPPINIAIACSVDAVQIAKINLGDYGEAETYGYQYLITVTNKGGKWAHVVVQFGVVPMA